MIQFMWMTIYILVSLFHSVCGSMTGSLMFVTAVDDILLNAHGCFIIIYFCYVHVYIYAS
jgi:hypothetical protein